MLYISYLVVTLLVVVVSSKASEYVDLLDKKTSLSGAFIGGVMLSAVTSLPELFTSTSSTLMLNKPGLCIGNILGSNLFNVTILAVLALVYYRNFRHASIAPSHTKVTAMVAMVYVAIALNMLDILRFDIFTVSITSLIILLLYFLCIKDLADDNGEEVEEDAESSSTLTVPQISFRFVLAAIAIILLSITMTYVTDGIAVRHNLGEGLAGALFLGVATSLPELVSTVTLFRYRNYNLAIGNIVGSNIFNFFILGTVDLFYIGGGLYDFSDPKTINLLFLGVIAMVLTFGLMKMKNHVIRIASMVGVAACYILFLVI